MVYGIEFFYWFRNNFIVLFNRMLIPTTKDAVLNEQHLLINSGTAL